MCYDCWGFSDDVRRDFRSGKTDPEDGWTETRHKKSGKPKKREKKQGCPNNDNGPHVYVWVRRSTLDPFWDSYFYKRYDYEVKVCCGCLKYATRRGRYGYRSINTRRVLTNGVHQLWLISYNDNVIGRRS